MSSFKLFRSKMRNSECCSLKYESSFIIEGTSAVEIRVLRLDKIKQAALIITDKEGPDTSLVYTYAEENKLNELNKADYFTWKDNTYFVYEDVDITREVNYKKQRAYQCNVDFVVNEQHYYGYFVSSLVKYVDTTLQKDLEIDGNEKPVLVMPKYDWLYIGQKFNFGGKTWKVIDFDLITNDKIAYISLDRAFDTTVQDISIMKTRSVDNNEFIAGNEYNLDINFGYFKTNHEVEIISKTADKVVFRIPYGIEELSITTKDENKVSISKNYKVVVA